MSDVNINFESMADAQREIAEIALKHDAILLLDEIKPGTPAWEIVADLAVKEAVLASKIDYVREYFNRLLPPKPLVCKMTGGFSNCEVRDPGRTNQKCEICGQGGKI